MTYEKAVTDGLRSSVTPWLQVTDGYRLAKFICNRSTLCFLSSFYTLVTEVTDKERGSEKWEKGPKGAKKGEKERNRGEYIKHWRSRVSSVTCNRLPLGGVPHA